MRKKDTADMFWSVLAAFLDASAIIGGILLATWIRFDSGWIPLREPVPSGLYARYLGGAAVLAVFVMLIIRNQGLYTRPQIGSFVNKIPRIMKTSVLGTLAAMVLAFTVQNEVEFSRLTIGISLFTGTFFLLLERYIMYRIEWNWSRHSRKANNVLILGTDATAAHVRKTLKREPMLRSRVIGFMQIDDADADQAIEQELVRGHLETLETFIRENEVDQIILTSSSLPHEKIVSIILLCEHNLITFNMVPDLFRLMTVSMDVQSVDDIPLLGVKRWPLDFFWNRQLKRLEDIAGAAIGLILSAPVMLIAAVLIKRDSPGPVFYMQERCGEEGTLFKLYKLRTMRQDAEKESGPVFTVEQDSRRTRIGSFLRRYNLDELPQLWNVLRGQMTLVGPRPERPHFVNQFKTDVSNYMWRHMSKPGMTGWAQVNGLRGDTSISERVKYDLYYLENWSLAFDFKILLKTFGAHDNAY